MATRKPKEEMHPAWRPSFVNEAALPDTKVVRTNFIYNFGAIALLVCLVSFVIFNELRLQLATKELVRNQQEIQRIEGQHMKAVRQSTEFRKASTELEEIVAFEEFRFPRSELLTLLSEQDLPDIVLNSFSFTPRVAQTGRGRNAKRTISYDLNLGGTIIDGDRAVELLEEFRQGMANSETLASYNPRWVQDSFNRNVAANSFTFTGHFILQPAAQQ